VLAALAFAAWAPAAGAQDLPVDVPAVEIPQSSAISEQYREVEEVVAEVVPPAPEPPAEPAPAPEPVPEPAPDPAPAEQYHSETPPSVSVTQNQPSNVNVSIRINSPGDDGPVVQINNAGGDAVVEQVVEAVQQQPAAPSPDPPPAALPETWEWVWTSACFAGAGRAAASVPGWSWRWSCEDDEAPIGVPGVPDDWPLADVPGMAEALAVGMPSLPSVLEPTRERAPRARREVAGVRGGGSPGAAPPPVALARSLATATTTVAAAATEPVRQAARAAVQARPGPADVSNLLFPPGEGPVAGAPSALGGVASLLLGVWIAVLTTAIALVLPRIRRRRWSGPARRLTRGSSSRLERPG
jgi:hypothetical protein